MALVIMYRHFRKQQKKSEIAKAWYESSSDPVPFSPFFHLYLLSFFLLCLLLLLFHLTCRHWIKVTLTLVVVMGIAWIANILFFDVNLLFIAYIMTIFIAGQGIIIFILFVSLSKQVRKPNAFISFDGAVCFNVCR